MRASLRRLFGLAGSDEPGGGGSSEVESVRKIVDALERLPEDEARKVASFAYLLSRVAHADLSISGEETAAMERIVVEHAGLPEAQAILVVEIAKCQTRLFGGTDNYLVGREFAALADREEKLHLLECLYAVSAADEHVSTAEDNEIAKIASQLGLSRDDLNAARRRQRRHLGTLKAARKQSDG